MKNTIFLVSIMLFFASCKKEDPTRYWGEVSATKIDEPWEAEIYAIDNPLHNQGINIRILKSDSRGFARENLSFIKIPLSISKTMLNDTNIDTIDSLSGADYRTLLDDGDVLGDLYDLFTIDSVPNFLEITKIDGEEIWGNFQVSFVKDLTYIESDPSAPDTLVFLDGQFHTRLVEVE